MTGRARSAAVLAGAAAGFFGGLFGIGGGAILVPMLTGVLGLSQHEAHGTSLAVIVFTSLTAGAVYAFHGNVAWLTGAIIGLASVAAAPAGARLAHRLSAPRLRRAYSVLLLLIAVRMLWTPPAGAGHSVEGVTRIAADLGIGVAAGFLAGFMGIGGGMVAVPALTLLLGFPQQLAQGTSLLAILGAATSGAAEHARRGAVARPLVPWLAVGAVVAGPGASWAVQHVPGPQLARGFAVFLIANAVYGWFRPPREAAD